MREIRPSGSEGGVALTTLSLPLSALKYYISVMSFGGMT